MNKHDRNNTFHHPLYSKAAVYRDQTIKEYKGNPLIEALPDVLSLKEAGPLLRRSPRDPKDDLDLPPELKVHCVSRLKELVYPLPEAFALESDFSRILRYGYKAHNPLDPATWRHRYQLAFNGKPGQPTGHIKSTASCLLVCGYSGMGKTTMAETILELYPQVIHHRNYKGTELCFTQIVYIKIGVPHDGLLSGICLNFFAAVDKVLGTDFMEQHKENKINFMLKKMEEIASNYFIGAIVVDDLQNLRFAKAGTPKALSYFRSLMDHNGIPLILIGTYSALDLFRAINEGVEDVQDTRRATEEGIIDIFRPNSEDKHWKAFLSAIEKYLWLDGKTKFSPSVRKEIYELSQGITDFAIRLVSFAQRMAIKEKKKYLTVKLLQRASDRHFSLLKPAIEALKSGNPEKMMKFEGLVSLSNRERMRKDRENITTPAPSIPEKDTPILSEPISTASQEAETTTERPVERKRKAKKRVPKETITEEGDIRNVPQGMLPYEAIKAQGLIPDQSEDEDAIKPTLQRSKKF